MEKDVFHEPAFEYKGETLTVWCVKDFLMNKKYSAEISRKARRIDLSSFSTRRTGRSAKALRDRRRSKSKMSFAKLLNL